MTIDLSLSKLKVPNIEGYQPVVGESATDNVSGRISVPEAISNSILPFERQRPIAITEDSNCTVIATNSYFIITATSEVNLDLGVGEFDGVKAEVYNKSSVGQYVNGDLIPSGIKKVYEWNDTQWIDYYANTETEMISRWLRFDFSKTNHKSVVIKAGTKLKIDGVPYVFAEDKSFDLSGDLIEAGKDYFIFARIVDKVFTLSATTDKPTGEGLYIGRLHTLCVDVGSVTMIAPAAVSSGLKSGDKFLVKPYRQETDPDFYNFYNKTVSAVTVQTYYDVVTVQHPLSGFEACDILPESVFCTTWKPHCLTEDAMVYDVATDIACDVYLQSYTGRFTRSAYGAAHTVSRQAWNHEADLNSVGKRMLKDFEFTSCALGSNERTNIVGSADKSTVGGHIDTNSRRMISAIGVEEMCGYLWQWVDDKCGNASADWHTEDGHGSFGQGYWNAFQLIAGGRWADGSLCGSRCRGAHVLRSHVLAYFGSRGSSQIIRGVYE